MDSFKKQLAELQRELRGVNWILASILTAIALLLIVCLPDTAKGTALAAIIALFVALVVYPWQKERDRMLKVAEEKRAAYQSFFEASELFFAKLRTAAFSSDADLPDEEFSKLEAAKSELAFRGDQAGVEACAELAQHLKDYRKFVKLCREETASEATRRSRDDAYWEVSEARIRAILKAREDAGVFDMKTSASEADIRSLFLIAKRRR